MTEFTCTKCDICVANNYHPMNGDGNLNSNIMFIYRNPTKYEHKNNIPLIDKEGQLFQRYLDLFNFNRNLIYITYAVRCYTPGHRYPTDIEIYNCYEHLDNELKQINPRIVVLLGLTAIRSYFKLAFTNTNLNIDYINAQYMIHNNRIVLFTINPYHAINSVDNRIRLFEAFTVLTNLYRIINPAHSTNINF